MQHDYLAFYQQLGLDPGCTWAELREKYRLLVRNWHPDRYTGDAAGRAAAEERTKDINQAFHALASYYKNHDCLPLPAALEAETGAATAPEPEQEAAGPASADQVSQPVVLERFGWRGAVAVGVAAAVVLVLFYPEQRGEFAMPETEAVAAPQPAVTPGATETTPNTAAQRYFTIGSTLMEVHEIQGVPTDTAGDVWHYGESRVEFADGAVVGWDSHPSFPLQARMDLPAQQPDQIRRGSTRDQVLTVQGRPSRMSGDAWDYGVSRVYFRGDLVVGWDNSPLTPLKVAEQAE